MDIVKVFRSFVLLLLILFIPVSSVGEENEVSETLTVHFLDVGQGDAAVIQCGGRTLMIDGGDKSANQFIFSYLKETLGLEYLDFVIATHPHDDHVKGLATALVACDVGTVYSPVKEFNDEGFLDFAAKLADRGGSFTVPHRGDSFPLGSATVTFLSEPRSEWDMNDQSLVVRLDFGNTSFLFTGDAAWEAEQDLLESGVDLSATVLKVGHHGSLTSSSQSFLDAVRPLYAIISVGYDNKYGLPSDETLMKLQRMNVSVFRTDKNGTIICTSDGESLTFEFTNKNRKW